MSRSRKLLNLALEQNGTKKLQAPSKETSLPCALSTKPAESPCKSIDEETYAEFRQRVGGFRAPVFNKNRATKTQKDGPQQMPVRVNKGKDSIQELVPPLQQSSGNSKEIDVAIDRNQTVVHVNDVSVPNVKRALFLDPDVHKNSSLQVVTLAAPTENLPAAQNINEVTQLQQSRGNVKEIDVTIDKNQTVVDINDVSLTNVEKALFLDPDVHENSSLQVVTLAAPTENLPAAQSINEVTQLQWSRGNSKEIHVTLNKDDCIVNNASVPKVKRTLFMAPGEQDGFRILEGDDAGLSLPVLTLSASDHELIEGRVLYTELSSVDAGDETNPFNQAVDPVPAVAPDEADATTVPVLEAIDVLDLSVEAANATDPSSFVTPSRKRTSRSRSGGSSSPKRKRSVNEHIWKRSVRKTLKNSGHAYTSSQGKEFPEVKIRDPCVCKLDCRHRLKEDQRQIIFRKFWQLGRHDRQWEFIRVNSSCVPTKPRKPGQVLKRAVSRSYHFTVDDQQVHVCKQMFMRTLGICDSWIDSAYKHVNPEKGYTVSPDKRGGYKKPINTLTTLKINSVKEHINLFPRVPSHYCRKRSKREYLDKGLSIAKMARMYQAWAKEKDFPQASIASSRQYRDILNTHFNIGFYKPKKDQCSLCCMMRSKDNTRALREEKKRTVCRSHKKQAKSKGDKN